ncbi:MAG: MFS transporter [Spongiibacteraceae bacterium]|nr:MFS transporter [Spongiibacteraceae bacterium]
MQRSINYKLSMMMFLQFFIWGSWFVTLGTFMANNLAATGGQIGMAFSTQSWGAIIAPFIIGLIADRYFNAERILGLLHLSGALLMYQLYGADDFGDFYPLLLLYMILYMPTLALVNAVAFHQMKDAAQEFSAIRVWGTIGWIVAGVMISYLFSWDSQQALVDGQLKHTFLMAAIASAILGALSFSLPKTEPANHQGGSGGLKSLLGLDALSLLKDKNFLMFFLSSILICIPLAFYYQNASPFLTEVGMENSTAKMTLGQVSEVLFMLCVPIFLQRFGIKITLLIAMLAWALRYVLFAFGDAGSPALMLLLGIALHGACYDFFFVAGQIYTDSKAGRTYRSAAQGMVTLATYGMGMLIGLAVAGKVTDTYVSDFGHDWQSIWLIPAAFSLIVLVVFALFFKREKMTVAESSTTIAAS